ncbi:hypothetical protein ACFL59_03850 [Planctomycetota bacterium]
MLASVVAWGTVVGVIHYVVLGAAYGNPWVDRLYRQAQAEEPGVKAWESRTRYLLYMFLGTQVEVYALSLGYFWLRPAVSLEGLPGTALLGLLFAAIRVYPRFWNMWIQSTYPNRLLGIEFANGVIGTLIIVVGLDLLTP